MSLSADQREAIGQVSYDWQLAHVGTAYKRHSGEIDAIADLFERWLGEARRDEQERIKAGIEAERWRKPDEPNSRIHDDQSGWRAWRSHEKAIDAALGVIEGSEATNRCPNCKGSGLVDQETGTPSHGMSSAAMECSECEGSGVIEGSEATDA